MALSPIKELASFTSQTAGLEKTLRLIQAASQVAGELSADSARATQLFTARDQLALGRRYFRLLDFYGCFERVHELLATPSAQGAILGTLELAEHTFLGLYLLLENFTILHDMNVYHVSWYTPLLTEANKFWFYAIVISIARASWMLLFPQRSKGEKGKPVAPVAGPSKSQLATRIVIDACDLTLPGSFTGWLPVTGLQIGLAMVVSTLLAGHGIWVARR
ncbi:PEX11 domain protein [Aspergillus lucknowensis]|uniref:Peroxisomal biogenesis factor 11 n=1 Tax=Aspergillus lucknowensis TaxID=176173 RepID=A0ABR4M013_9EURO